MNIKHFRGALVGIIACLPLIAVADLEEVARLYSENYERAAAAQNAGDYSGAEEWHRTNLTLIESTPGVPPDVRVQARYNLASVIMYQGRLSKAESILDEAQGILDANPQIDPTIKAYFLLNSGGLKGKQHELKAAEELLEQGLAILEDTTGLRDAGAAGAEIELARIQVQLGKLKKAESNYRHALWVLSGLGFTKSTPLFEEAIDEHEELLDRLGIK